MAKNLVLKDCDAAKAEMLIHEIGKVRCWITGFVAGRSGPNSLNVGVAGEDSLRQVQILLKEAIAASKP